MDGGYAGSIPSRDSGERVTSLDGVIDGLWSTLCMEQLIHLCLNSSSVISCRSKASPPIITIAPLPSEHLAGNFLHRLMRLDWCNRLQCGCLFCISVESTRLDDGRKPYMRFLYVRPEVCPRVSRFPESGFLQISSHDEHPCLRLCPSHYRADSGLSPDRVGRI